jgi:hypothetical protein
VFDLSASLIYNGENKMNLSNEALISELSRLKIELSCSGFLDGWNIEYIKNRINEITEQISKKV